jgi:PadR family transcriptional regulator PadR
MGARSSRGADGGTGADGSTGADGGNTTQSGRPSNADIRGHLDALLLAAVADGPVHGYGIIERLRTRTGGSVSLEGGTLYPALRGLEESGLVRGEWTNAAGRRRRVYALTEEGMAALHGKRGAWREFVRTLGSVLDGPSAPRAGGLGTGRLP